MIGMMRSLRSLCDTERKRNNNGIMNRIVSGCDTPTMKRIATLHHLERFGNFWAENNTTVSAVRGHLTFPMFVNALSLAAGQRTRAIPESAPTSELPTSRSTA